LAIVALGIAQLVAQALDQRGVLGLAFGFVGEGDDGFAPRVPVIALRVIAFKRVVVGLVRLSAWSAVNSSRGLCLRRPP
jgi:hypothetical protein